LLGAQDHYIAGWDCLSSVTTYAPLIHLVDHSDYPEQAHLLVILNLELGTVRWEKLPQLCWGILHAGSPFSRIPHEWKIHKICPIPKGGDRSNVCNYRPISLHCTTSKVLEKAVYNRIISFIRPKFQSNSLASLKADHACHKTHFLFHSHRCLMTLIEVL